MIDMVYLHIGTNKAGSSALQYFFGAHRELLRKRGLLYPRTGCTGGDAQYGLSEALGFGQAREPASPDRLRQLRAELEHEAIASGCRRLLISSEYFVLPAELAVVRDFFAGLDVKIVVYLRRHDEWWFSAYNQFRKGADLPEWANTFDGYLAWQQENGEGYWHYRTLLERWAEVFGKANIIVRPYEQQQNEPDIATDFMRAIGMPHLVDGLNTRMPRVNESLVDQCIDLISVYRCADLPHHLRANLIHQAQTLVPSDTRRSNCVSPATRRRVVDENMVDYAWIAREFLGRENGRLFRDPLPEANDTAEVPLLATAAEIVEWTARALRPAAFERADVVELVPEARASGADKS